MAERQRWINIKRHVAVEREQNPRRPRNEAEKSRMDTAALASFPKTPFSAPFLRWWRWPSI